MMAGGVHMPAPFLITAVDLADRKPGEHVTVPKGTIVTPG